MSMMNSLLLIWSSPDLSYIVNKQSRMSASFWLTPTSDRASVKSVRLTCPRDHEATQLPLDKWSIWETLGVELDEDLLTIVSPTILMLIVVESRAQEEFFKK